MYVPPQRRRGIRINCPGYINHIQSFFLLYFLKLSLLFFCYFWERRCSTECRLALPRSNSNLASSLLPSCLLLNTFSRFTWLFLCLFITDICQRVFLVFCTIDFVLIILVNLTLPPILWTWTTIRPLRYWGAVER